MSPSLNLSLFFNSFFLLWPFSQTVSNLTLLNLFPGFFFSLGNFIFLSVPSYRIILSQFLPLNFYLQHYPHM